MSIILYIESEEESYELVVSKKKMVLGRSSKADLKIQDDRISGKHCQIYLTEYGKVIVQDLDSTNGTFQGASQIENADIMIGDKIRIGNTIISIMESELSPKELKILTKNEEATQIRYLDLNNSDDSTRHAIDIRKKAIKKKAPIRVSSEEEEPTSANQRLKDQILIKAKKLKKSTRQVNLDYEYENTLAMEAETGKTGLIQIDKILQNTKKPNLSKVKKRKEVKKPTLISKIKSIFKKKDND